MPRYSSRLAGKGLKRKTPLGNGKQARDNKGTFKEKEEIEEIVDSPVFAVQGWQVEDKKAGIAVPKVIKKVAKAVIKAAPTVIKAIPEAVKTIKTIRDLYGGAIPVGGKINSTPYYNDEFIDSLTPQVIEQVVANMDNQQFHILQGLGAAHLNFQHPMAEVTKKILGGAFDVPRKISKIGMRDILKANSGGHLARAINSEWTDFMGGHIGDIELGGGITSSVKHLLKKGQAGAQKVISAAGKGYQAAKMISTSLSNAINKGLQIASILHPHIKNLHPKIDQIIVKGMESAENAKRLLDAGINLANEAEGKISIVKNIYDVVKFAVMPDQPKQGGDTGAGFAVSIPLGTEADISEPESPEFVG